MNDRHKSAALVILIMLAIVSLFIPGTVDLHPILFSALFWLGAIGMFTWMAFDKRIWRTKSMLKTWVDRPDLYGTWGATLRSNWTDPTTGKTLQAIEAYMVIKQTFGSIRMRLLTSESSSEVLGASVLSAGNGKYRIAAIYRSNTKQGRESGHTGMMVLEVLSKRPKRLSGRYSTDRGTEGEIEMHGRSRTLFPNFREAREAFLKSKAKTEALAPSKSLGAVIPGERQAA